MLASKSFKDVKYLPVISIDNLDRCPHRQIIEVLEAVHLLLEYNEVCLHDCAPNGELVTKIALII